MLQTNERSGGNGRKKKKKTLMCQLHVDAGKTSTFTWVSAVALSASCRQEINNYNYGNISIQTVRQRCRKQHAEREGVREREEGEI